VIAIDLSGKVALVVGGSRGIGAGIVHTLCRAGAGVVFTHTGDRRHGDRLKEFLARIQEEGGWAKAVALDARDAAGAKRLADEMVEERGGIDILVHNVGRNVPRLAEDVPDEEWAESLHINLTSAFYAVRAVLPHMLKVQRGRIILIGSSAAYDGGGGAIGYAAAKASLNGMMLYLARNYARKGILTNVVHPCVIDTDLLRERYATEESRKELTSQIPVGRLGTPVDIAGLVAYLASSWGDYICGQAILVDGGRTLWR